MRWTILGLVVLLAVVGCDPDDGGEGFSSGPGDDAVADTYVPDTGGSDIAIDVSDANGEAQDGESDISDAEGDGLEADGEEGDVGPTGIPCSTEGSACDDENPCTENDVCNAGFCRGTPRFSDGLDCTRDCAVNALGEPVKVEDVLPGFCVVEGACWAAETKRPKSPCQWCNPTFANKSWTFVLNGTACSDGNACTSDDVCSNGKCAGKPLFDDGNPCTLNCTVDLNTGAPIEVSIATPDGEVCVGPDACFVNYTCKKGACEGQPRDCTAELEAPCFEVACEEGACVKKDPKADGDPCDDGNQCTDADMCAEGECVGSQLDNGHECNDGNQCSGSDTCQEGVCIGLPLFGTPCDDGDPCTDSDKCTEGVCAGQSIPCDDGGPCKDGNCVAGECLYFSKLDGTGCDDGDACTDGDSCKSGECVGALKDCPDDPSPCRDSICLDGDCLTTFVADNEPCDDGDLCTFSDRCTAGECEGSPVNCPVGQQCEQGECITPEP